MCSQITDLTFAGKWVALGANGSSSSEANAACIKPPPGKSPLSAKPPSP